MNKVVLVGAIAIVAVIIFGAIVMHDKFVHVYARENQQINEVNDMTCEQFKDSWYYENYKNVAHKKIIKSALENAAKDKAQWCGL